MLHMQTRGIVTFFYDEILQRSEHIELTFAIQLKNGS